jgi:hypothetical protein
MNPVLALAEGEVRGGNGMAGLGASIAIGTDLGIPAMLSGEASLGLQVGECARFCIDPAAVRSPFLTPAADVIGRVISNLTKTVHPS